MRIAEMEAHHDDYEALEANIIEAFNRRDFQAMFPACVASFPHIVPACKFRKKREISPEIPKLLSFIMIWKYAPPLFEHDAMASLFDFVKSTRLLAKHINGYLQSTEVALASEEVARVLWNAINQNPGFVQSDIRNRLELEQQFAEDILDIWEELGLIVRRRENGSNVVYLTGRLDTKVTGICHNCGVVGTARKELFLEPISCKRCGSEGYYLIIDTDCK